MLLSIGLGVSRKYQETDMGRIFGVCCVRRQDFQEMSRLDVQRRTREAELAPDASSSLARAALEAMGELPSDW